jgi:hypothetical protein
MKNLRRLSLILTVLTALLAPSLANASAGHAHRCRSGDHQKITRRHHKRHISCVKNKAAKHHTNKPAHTTPTTTPPPAPSNPTPEPSNPTATNPPAGTNPGPPSTTPPPPPPSPPSPFSSTAAQGSAMAAHGSLMKTQALRGSAMKAQALRGSAANTNYATADPGVTFGTADCGFGQITVEAPLVNSPTGQWVYAIDQVWAAPTSEAGSAAAWSFNTSGDWYYNGTYRPVFDWYNDRTNQIAGFGEMDGWNIGSGWTVAVFQYVWDNGVYYSDLVGECSG